MGLTMTHTELKHDGISVSDTASNDGTSGHSEREKTALVNILKNKMDSFSELHAEQMNALCWADGTADAKAMAGITSIIVADPSVGVVGGFDRSLAANAGWRNRARTAAFQAKVAVTPALSAHGGDAVTSSTANGGALIGELQKEWRQLRRYGGKPDTILCGSDFLDAYQVEIRANGSYSQTGFQGRQDAAMGEAYFKKVHLQYDPTLDDMGLQKRAYIFDSRHVFVEKMEDEWRRLHTPARPNNQFVMHKSMTSTGQMVAKQCNSALIALGGDLRQIVVKGKDKPITLPELVLLQSIHGPDAVTNIIQEEVTQKSPADILADLQGRYAEKATEFFDKVSLTAIPFINPNIMTREKQDQLDAAKREIMAGNDPFDIVENNPLLNTETAEEPADEDVVDPQDAQETGTDEPDPANVIDTHKGLLQRVQRFLYDEEEWPNLDARFPKDVPAGALSVALPETLNPGAIQDIYIQDVETAGAQPYRLKHGREDEEKIAADPTEPGWPVTRWLLEASTSFDDVEFERTLTLWQIPDRDCRLHIYGRRALSPFTDDAHRSTLDSDLIVLQAASELLAKDQSPDAPVKASAAKARKDNILERERGDVADTLYVFGTVASVTGLPQVLTYQQLVHTNGALTITRILKAETFGEELYVVAKMSDNTEAHFLDGVHVTDQSIAGPYALSYKKKMFSTNGRNLRFSAIGHADVLDPDNTAGPSSTNLPGAGIIDMKQEDGSGGDLMSLVPYYSFLAVMARTSIQLWAMDPDPALSQQIQTLGSTGLIAHNAAARYANGDVLFLSDTGIRSIRARDSSNAAVLNDIGSPIDALIREKRIAEFTSPEDPIFAEVDPLSGHFWLAWGNDVYVLAYYPASKVSAWSRFRFDEPIDYLARGSSRLFFRSGNKIYIYGAISVGGDPLDDSAGFPPLTDWYDDSELVVQTPMIDVDDPATTKRWSGLDLVGTGTWKVEIAPDPLQPDSWTAAGTATAGTTYSKAVCPCASLWTREQWMTVRLTVGPDLLALQMIASRMRQVDQDEIYATSWTEDPNELANRTHAAGDFQWVVWKDDDPVASQEAAQARAAEEARAAQIRQGSAAIDEQFSRFDDAFYDDRGEAYLDYYQPQLENQFQEAMNRLTFSLARAGTTNSSIAGKEIADLQSDYDLQLADLATRRDADVASLRGRIQDERSGLTSQLNQTGNAEAASSAALTRSQQLYDEAPQYVSLGDVFSAAGTGIGSYVSGVNDGSRAMCDPVTAGAIALTVGGAALKTKQQYDVADAQERAIQNANAISLSARNRERERQEGFNQEQTQAWETTREALTPEQHDTIRAQATQDMLSRLSGMGGGSEDPAAFISTQDRSSNEVRDTIARQTSSAAAKTRQQIEALADLNAYGTATQERGIALAQGQDLASILSGLRRGSLDVAQLEQSIPAARVTANPLAGGLAEIMSSIGSADAARALAEQRRVDAERAAFETAGAQAVRDYFGPGGAGAGMPLTPEALAPLMGNLLTMNDDPVAAVQAGVGANIAVNPQLYGETDFSNVLIGTGIQNDFADTPTGFNAELTEDARQSDLARIFDYDELLLEDATRRRGQDLDHGTPDNPRPLSVDEAITVAEQFAAQAEQLGLDLDDEEMAAAGQRVIDIYNGTNDPATAINQTIREFLQAEQMAAQNREGGFFGVGAETPSSLEFVPFDVEQLGQPTATQPAAPKASAEQASLSEAWAATSNQPPQEGDTLRDQNGAPVYEFTGGRWIPYTQSIAATSDALPIPFGPPYTPPTQEQRRRGDRSRRVTPESEQSSTRRGDRRDRRDETQGTGSFADIFSELVVAAQELERETGIPAGDLLTVIGFESAGTYNPAVRGGAGNNYIGLIQFGPWEQNHYGVSQQSSVTEQFADVLSPSVPPGAPVSPLPAAPVGEVEVASIIPNPKARPGSLAASLPAHPVTPVEKADLPPPAAQQSESAALASVFADLSTPPSRSIQGSPDDHQYADQNQKTIQRELARESESAPRISTTFPGSPAPQPTQRREETTPRPSESSGGDKSIYNSGSSGIAEVFGPPVPTKQPRRETTPRLSEQQRYRTVTREVANPEYEIWGRGNREAVIESAFGNQTAAEIAMGRRPVAQPATPPPPRTITVRERVPVPQPVRRQPVTPPAPVSRPATPSSSGGGGVFGSINSFLNGIFHNSRPSVGTNAPGFNSGAGGSVVMPDQPSRSGGSSGGGGGGTVICTHFYKKGDITRLQYMANVAWTERHVSGQTFRGYHFWAVPYVELMRKSPLAERVMLPILKARTDELLFKLGKRERGSFRGKLARLFFESMSWLIGAFAGPPLTDEERAVQRPRPQLQAGPPVNAAEERSFVERNLVDPLGRGFNRMQMAGRVQASRMGLTDPDTAAAAVVGDMADLDQYPVQPEDQAFLQDISAAETFGEATREIFTELPSVGRLAVEQGPNIGVSAAGGLVGGTVGSLAGPIGSSVGAAAGAGLAGGGLEYAMSVLEQLQEAGLTQDAQLLATALGNDEFMQHAEDYAASRATPIGLMDAVSALLIGRLSGPAAAILSRGVRGSVIPAAGGVAVETAAQGGLGMAGEVLAQLNSEGEVTSPGEAVLEGVLEVPGAVAEIPSIFANRNAPLPAPAQTAEQGGAAPPPLPEGQVQNAPTAAAAPIHQGGVSPTPVGNAQGDQASPAAVPPGAEVAPGQTPFVIEIDAESWQAAVQSPRFINQLTTSNPVQRVSEPVRPSDLQDDSAAEPRQARAETPLQDQPATPEPGSQETPERDAESRRPRPPSVTEENSRSQDVWQAMGRDPAQSELMPAKRQIQVLTADTKKRFGFKAVSAKGRRGPAKGIDATNQLKDAHRGLQEMAHVLGMPVDGFGLKGSLSLSLERRHSGYLGVYSPATRSIYLPGRSNSFAHEWFHALDHHLSDRVEALDAQYRADLMSRNVRAGALIDKPKKPVEEAFINLLNLLFFDEAKLAAEVLRLENSHAQDAKARLERIRSGARGWSENSMSDFRARVAQLTGEQSSYWANAPEMLARSFEAYVAHKMENEGARNAFVTKGEKSYTDSTRFMAQLYPSVQERMRIHLAFDQLFTALSNEAVFGDAAAATKPDAESLFDPQHYNKVMANESPSLRTQLKDEVLTVTRQVQAIHDTGPLAYMKKALKTGTTLAGVPQNLQGGLIRDTFAGMLASIKGRMSQLEKRNKDAGGRFIGFLRDKLTDRPGTGRFVGKDYESEAEHEAKRAATAIEDALTAEKLLNTTTEQIKDKDVLRNLLLGENVEASAGQIRAANVIRQEINDAYTYSDNAGVEMGFVNDTGYLRRATNQPKVNADRDGFVERASEVEALFFEREHVETDAAELLNLAAPLTMKVGQHANKQVRNAAIRVRDALRNLTEVQQGGDDAAIARAEAQLEEVRQQLFETMHEPWARMMAHEWMVSSIAGNPTEFTARGPTATSTKERKLPPETDHLLKDYLIDDPIEVTLDYLRMMYERGAYVKRFGVTGGETQLDVILNRKENASFANQKRFDPKTEDGRFNIMTELADPRRDDLIAIAEREAVRAGFDQADLDEFKDLMNHATGRIRAGGNQALRRLTSTLYLYQILALLPRVAWTSFAEPAVMLLRTGNGKATAETFKAYAGALTKWIGATQRTKDVSAMARAVGLINTSLFDTVLANRLDADFAQPIAGQRLVGRFMRKGALLTPLTNAQYEAAMRGHHVYLRDLAKLMTDSEYREAHSVSDETLRSTLNEYKIPPNRQAEFAEWIMDDSREFLIPMEDLDSEMGQIWRWAVLHGVDTTIQNPFRVDKSPLALTDYGRIVWGLLSFIYKFTQEIYGRAIAQGDRRAAELRGQGKGRLSAAARASAEQAGTLAVGFTTLVTAQFLQSTLREAIFSPERWEEKEEEGEWFSWMVMLAISRSGMFGPADPILNALTGLRYERDLTSLTSGPAGGYIFNNIANVINGVVPNVPVVGPALDWFGIGGRNSPNTLTGEHTAAKSFYRLVAQPGVSFGFSMIPVPGPVTQAGVTIGLQALTSAGAATAFADAVVPGGRD
eukprot:g17241.t1